MNYHLSPQKGFTLIEILVSVFIFSLIMVIAAGIFISGLKAQQRALQGGQLLNQASYVAEYMSRFLRMARKDDGTCIGDKLNYQIEGQGIRFRNYKGQCQKFYLEAGRLKEERDGLVSNLTSDNLKVLAFRIEALGWPQPPADYLQPRVTLFLELATAGPGANQPSLQLQTTISQRNLDRQQ